MRGGEVVLEVMLREFPDAPVFTLFHDKGSVSKEIESHPIFTSFIQNLPLRKRFYRFMLPLFPYAVEGFSLREYELIISVSHCVAKGIIPPPGSFHLCYLLSPMRYIWDLFDDYFGRTRGVERFLISFFAKSLREWDTISSSRVDLFVAISSYVAERIKKFYGREAIVLHPPVYVDRFEVRWGYEDFYLIVSALAPYKRIDLAVEAFSKLKKVLVIVGKGQEEKRLRKLIKEARWILYLGWQNFDVVRTLMGKCKAFVFPGIEDFGIAPVEAMACGKPVIAYGKGGIVDSVIPLGSGKEEPTGIFFYEQTPDALISAVNTFERHLKDFNPDAIRRHAEKFSEKIFLEKFRGLLEGIKKGAIKRR